MDTESLRNLDSTYRDLRSILKNIERKYQYSEKMAMQLGAAYSIFECILFTYFLHPSAVVIRGKWWIPFFLSSSVAVAFWLTFTITVRDCLRNKRQQDMMLVEQQELYDNMFAIRNGLRQSDDLTRDASALDVMSFQHMQYKRYAYVAAVCSALLCFTFAVFYALATIPQQGNVDL